MLHVSVVVSVEYFKQQQFSLIIFITLAANRQTKCILRMRSLLAIEIEKRIICIN